MTKKEACKKYSKYRNEYINKSFSNTKIDELIESAENYTNALKDCRDAGFKTKLEIKKYLAYLQKNYE